MRLTIALMLLMPLANAQQFDGRWRGEGRSFAPIRSGNLTFDIQIDGQGLVTGQVGDARIRNGQIRARKWHEPRAFNHFEYRIDFDLDGPLSVKDGVVRTGGRINLDFDGRDLRGWFISSGLKAGSPERRQVSALGLVLRRVE